MFLILTSSISYERHGFFAFLIYLRKIYPKKANQEIKKELFKTKQNKNLSFSIFVMALGINLKIKLN
jgi:hypothetical protein